MLNIETKKKIKLVKYRDNHIALIYLDEKNLSAEFLGQGFTWLDMGTHDSLIEAANFVKIIESRQGIRIADLDNLQSY